MNYNFLISIIVFLTIINFTGCVENNNGYIDNIVIVHHEFNHRDDWLEVKEVTGIVNNSSNESLFKVTVRVKFYSESNRLLKEKFDFISNLEPNQEKDFRVVYDNYEKFYSDVNYYKVDISEYILN